MKQIGRSPNTAPVLQRLRMKSNVLKKKMVGPLRNKDKLLVKMEYMAIFKGDLEDEMDHVEAVNDGYQDSEGPLVLSNRLPPSTIYLHPSLGCEDSSRNNPQLNARSDFRIV